MDGNTLILVCNFLTFDRVIACFGVCREWSRLNSSVSLWRLLLRRDAQLVFPQGVLSPADIRLAYQDQVVVNRKAVERIRMNISDDSSTGRGTIASAFWGRLDELKALLLPLSVSALCANLNTLKDYAGWVYYGNYSSTQNSSILRRQNGDFVPHSFSDCNRVTMYHPNTRRGTLLHWACVAGQTEIVEYLLSTFPHFIDPTILIPAYRATAEDVCRANGHLELASMVETFSIRRRKSLAALEPLAQRLQRLLVHVPSETQSDDRTWRNFLELAMIEISECETQTVSIEALRATKAGIALRAVIKELEKISQQRTESAAGTSLQTSQFSDQALGLLARANKVVGLWKQIVDGEEQARAENGTQHDLSRARDRATDGFGLWWKHAKIGCPACRSTNSIPIASRLLGARIRALDNTSDTSDDTSEICIRICHGGVCSACIISSPSTTAQPSSSALPSSCSGPRVPVGASSMDFVHPHTAHCATDIGPNFAQLMCIACGYAFYRPEEVDSSAVIGDDRMWPLHEAPTSVTLNSQLSYLAPNATDPKDITTIPALSRAQADLHLCSKLCAEIIKRMSFKVKLLVNFETSEQVSPKRSKTTKSSGIDYKVVISVALSQDAQQRVAIFLAVGDNTTDSASSLTLTSKISIDCTWESNSTHSSKMLTSQSRPELARAVTAMLSNCLSTTVVDCDLRSLVKTKLFRSLG